MTPVVQLGPPELPVVEFRGADITEVLLHDRLWLGTPNDVVVMKP